MPLSVRLAEVFASTAERSPTFRDLVAAIERSDLGVSIVEGSCGGDARSCLHLVPSASGRHVYIRIDPRQPILSVVRQLAHELRHAVELAGAPDVVVDASLQRLYEHREMSKDDAARADLERAAALAGRAPFYLGLLGHWYAHKRMRAEVLDVVDELDRKSREMYVPPQCHVYIYAGLGERQKALDYQEKAYEDGASPFGYLTPFIRDLYALDPHQRRRLEQMRLVL